MGKQVLEQGSKGTNADEMEGCSGSVTPGSELLKHYFPLPWSAQLGVDTATNDLSGEYGGQALSSISAKAEAAVIICISQGHIVAKKGDV